MRPLRRRCGAEAESEYDSGDCAGWFFVFEEGGLWDFERNQAQRCQTEDYHDESGGEFARQYASIYQTSIASPGNHGADTVSRLSAQSTRNRSRSWAEATKVSPIINAVRTRTSYVLQERATSH